jgi:hypothetical protein
MPLAWVARAISSPQARQARDTPANDCESSLAVSECMDYVREMRTRGAPRPKPVTESVARNVCAAVAK